MEYHIATVGSQFFVPISMIRCTTDFTSADCVEYRYRLVSRTELYPFSVWQRSAYQDRLCFPPYSTVYLLRIPCHNSPTKNDLVGPGLKCNLRQDHLRAFRLARRFELNPHVHHCWRSHIINCCFCRPESGFTSDVDDPV